MIERQSGMTFDCKIEEMMVLLLEFEEDADDDDIIMVSSSLLLVFELLVLDGRSDEKKRSLFLMMFSWLVLASLLSSLFCANCSERSRMVSEENNNRFLRWIDISVLFRKILRMYVSIWATDVWSCQTNRI